MPTITRSNRKSSTDAASPVADSRPTQTRIYAPSTFLPLHERREKELNLKRLLEAEQRDTAQQQEAAHAEQRYWERVREATGIRYEEFDYWVEAGLVPSVRGGKPMLTEETIHLLRLCAWLTTTCGMQVSHLSLDPPVEIRGIDAESASDLGQ